MIALVVTLRKIETVGLSVVYFKHRTNWGQIIAILILVLATIYEYIDGMASKPQRYQRKEKF